MSIVFDRILGFCLLKVKSRMIVAVPLTNGNIVQNVTLLPAIWDCQPLFLVLSQNNRVYSKVEINCKRKIHNI